MVTAQKNCSNLLTNLTISSSQVQSTGESVGKELGRGAYGRVFTVKYRGLICAAKEIHSLLVKGTGQQQERQGHSVIRESFLRECQHCSMLHHPNIVEFIGIYYPKLHSTIPVLIMELMDESLYDYMTSLPKSDWMKKGSILIDVAEGLCYLHTQKLAVVHRDLSPKNILLKGGKGTVPVAKIGDLGVSKIIKADSSVTQRALTRVPGTADFMPPESFDDEPVYDIPFDVFSYGGIMLFVATHQWPTPIAQVKYNPATNKLVARSEVERRQKYLNHMTGYGERWRPLIKSCLSNDPSKRPTMPAVTKQLKDLEKPLPRGWEERTDANEKPLLRGWEERANANGKPLPRGWEERTDANGRVYYIDRYNMHAQWKRPTATPSQNVSTLWIARGMERIQQRPTSQGRQRSASMDSVPPGWERRVSQTGREYFMDHNTQTTTWIHPNKNQNLAGLYTTSLNGSQVSSVRNRRQSTGSFLGTESTRLQENGILGPLPDGWEMRTLNDGRKYFLDHDTHSTQWEDPRVIKLIKVQNTAIPYLCNYRRKVKHFREQLQSSKPVNLPRQLTFMVRRDRLFEDSHYNVMRVSDGEKDKLKARLYIKFTDESDVDYDESAREWFFLLSCEMFNPSYGLFKYSASDNYTLQISPDSGYFNEHHLEHFRFIGRICGMAIYHQKLIDAHFIRPFYKMLIGKKITVRDMESVDAECYDKIKYISDNHPEPLCWTFSTYKELMGEVEEVDLKPDGRNIEVNEGNKMEYIQLMTKWRLEDSVKHQMNAFKEGFEDIIPLSLLKIFDEKEIEYLMCGLGKINVDDWRKNTIYEEGYKETDDVIKWFWKAVESFDNEFRARLLQFVTGTSQVPTKGFSELQGRNGPQRFCIKKIGNPENLPKAHTSFNRLDLPPYRSYHELKVKLCILGEISV